jgi:predicted RNA binding protein YcfA (HicA-like mRNA interferase family)
MRPRQLIERLQSGHFSNVRFRDFVRLIEALGFELDRVRGSHRLYRHPTVGVRLNVQPLTNGDSKVYQLRQFLTLVDKYDLSLEDPKR